MDFSRKSKAGFNVFKARFLRKNVPLSITLRITYRCNYHCKYCINWKLKEKEMTTEQIFSMIDEFVDMGTQKIGFTGGEPLIRKDIYEVIDYCKEKGLITTMNSNGFFVSRNIDKLKNLDILFLSLDGKPETQDSQREPGSQARVLEAMQKATDSGIKVMANTVITNANLTELDYLLDLAKEMGFGLTAQPATTSSFVSDKIDPYLLDKDTYKQIIDTLIQKKKEGEPLAFSTSTYKHLYDSQFDKIKFKCWAGKLFTIVTPSGNVFPCAGFVDKIDCINGVEKGFKTAFEDIPEISCDRCNYSCYINNNLLFAFDFNTVINQIKSF